MSAPAQVTEAHRRLVRLVSWAGISGKQVEEKAQLIADSEAAARQKVRDQFCRVLDEREPALPAMRAEVERLRAESAVDRDLHRSAATRAERAEAELATERARLDYLNTRGFEHRHHATGDHLGYEWTISSYSESEDVTLRDVIDAEMREEAELTKWKDLHMNSKPF